MTKKIPKLRFDTFAAILFLWLHALCQQDLVCIYKLRVISYLAYENTVPATRYLVAGSKHVKLQQYLENSYFFLFSKIEIPVSL